MRALPADPRLDEYKRHIAGLQWAALILDSEWRLAWVSDELKEFIRATEETDLGYGLHIAEAFTQDVWLAGIDQHSSVELFSGLAPFMLTDLKERDIEPAKVIPEPFMSLLNEVTPAEIPFVWSTTFQAVDPADRELPPYPVNLCFMRLHDSHGSFIGWLALMFMGVRPNLLTLLARGDEQMYERMARLVEPRQRQAAILFCDLHGSGPLSRRLPSINYFRLVRELWTGIDSAVAKHLGIIGKHAGDGASAYFLVDDVGDPSKAAAAALAAAHQIHELSADIFQEALETGCLMKVGLHWGGSLYMGQLVPGGRLDVSALGDEVNEAARIQEAAGPGETVASKQLLEQLYPEDAAAVGLNLEKILYQPLSELAPESAKVVRDAGAIAVATIA